MNYSTWVYTIISTEFNEHIGRHADKIIASDIYSLSEDLGEANGNLN